MYRALLLLALLAIASIAMVRWLGQPYRHRRKSVDDLPKLLSGFAQQLVPGAEIHIETPRRAGQFIVATVGRAGGSKTLRVGDNEWPVSDPDTPVIAARVISGSLESSGWRRAQDLTVWARGAFDPDYLRELYGDLESTSRLPRWLRHWAGRRRAKV